jgi:hypothetical protein
MDSKETPGISATQVLWHDLMLSVLHDTASHLLFHARRDGDGAYRLSEEEFRLVHGRIDSDRDLLMYVGEAAAKIPEDYMRGGELLNAIEQILSFGGRRWYFGYSLSNESQDAGELIACPGFTVSAILACMFFRIPAGDTQEPTELTSSLSANSPGGSKPYVSIKLQTRRPLSSSTTAHLNISDQGFWDRWHHSWSVAYSYAERYQGKCSARITPENRVVVTLDLPALSAAETHL